MSPFIHICWRVAIAAAPSVTVPESWKLRGDLKTWSLILPPTLYRVIGYGALPADGLLVDDTIDEGLKANTSAFGPLEYIHSLSLPYAKPCCMALSA